MTPAATMEMAIGRKTSDLATDSYGTRSVRTAISRPSPTVSAVPKTSQITLFRSALSILGSVTKF
jgi:hypothetical protein